MNCLLRSTINQIQNELIKKVPNLNYGGCVIFARYLAKALEDRNIKYKVALMDEEVSCLNTTQKNLQNKLYGKAISLNHIAISINNYIIDGYNTYKYSPKLNIFGDGDLTVKLSNGINSKDLYSYSKAATWNSCYKQNNNKTVNKIIQKMFKQYDEIKNMS